MSKEEEISPESNHKLESDHMEVEQEQLKNQIPKCVIRKTTDTSVFQMEEEKMPAD
jgi:hypothetical protein